MPGMSPVDPRTQGVRTCAGGGGLHDLSRSAWFGKPRTVDHFAAVGLPAMPFHRNQQAWLRVVAYAAGNGQFKNSVRNGAQGMHELPRRDPRQSAGSTVALLIGGIGHEAVLAEKTVDHDRSSVFCGPESRGSGNC